MQSFRFLVIGFALIIFAGCQTTSPLPQVDLDALLQDSHFDGYQQISVPTQQEIFRLDGPAKNFVAREIAADKHPLRRMRALALHLFDASNTNLLYVSNANTSAAETFHKRAANCLSLSIMAYSLAEEAGLQAHFNEVAVPEFWTRREGFNLLNGHINLTVVPFWGQDVVYIDDDLALNLLVDFDPVRDQIHLPSQQVSKDYITALFYNNLAAEALLQNKPLHAYAFLRAGLYSHARTSQVWVNLGILYRQQGLFSAAEKAYQQAIAIEDKQLSAWENLAALYRYDGRENEAQAITQRLARIRRNNPYYHYIQGETLLEQRDFAEARRAYNRAVDLAPDHDLFYFGLAKAYLGLGELERSRHYLHKARGLASSERQSQRYQNKLELLANINSQ